MPADSNDKVRIHLESWSLVDAQRLIAAAALERHGSVDAAAAAMNIRPNALRRIMEAHGIKDPEKAQGGARRGQDEAHSRRPRKVGF